MAEQDAAIETPTAAVPIEPRPTAGRRVVRLLVNMAVATVLLVMVAWATGALYYSPLPDGLRPMAAGVMLVGGAWAALRRRRRWPTRAVLLLIWVGIAVYWRGITPSNTRTWVTDVAVLPTVQFEGDRVTIDNVRNFTYRSADDYTPAYDRRTYDLNGLRSVGFVVSYFTRLQGIAHTFLTFGFDDGQYVSISIEVRREQGETYSPLPGLFKRFELTYIVADEHDTIGSRTTYRDEDVYLYPMSLNAADARALFEDMLAEVDRLSTTPEFYNTIYPNCTTRIVHHLGNIRSGRVRYDFRMLLNGFSDQLAFERGALATALPFDEARQRFRINALARAADGAPDFSTRIRAAWPPELRR